MSELRHVFISPHPDDAVWSCGGRIANLIAEGHKVLIITCFDGEIENVDHSVFEYPANIWRQVARPSLRQQEDIAAIDQLGADRRSLGFVDAALRRSYGRWTYINPESLNSPPAVSDHALIGELTAALSSSIREADILHVPLANSIHVDHTLISLAVERLGPDSVVYFEEFPYQATRPLGCDPEYHAVDMDAWIRAAITYRSQVRSLFGSYAAFQARLRDWAARRGSEVGLDYAERNWRPRAAR